MALFASLYARALAEAVMTDKLDTREVDRQLEDFRATFAGSTELQEVFENPSITLDTKLQVLDAIAPRIGAMRQVRNFLAVILQNGRMHGVGAILAEYRAEINVRLRIADAEIASTRELDAGEREEIEAKAAALTGLKIRARYRQDPSLLGGILLRIGDTIYDGTVRGKLEELREQLIAS